MTNSTAIWSAPTRITLISADAWAPALRSRQLGTQGLPATSSLTLHPEPAGQKPAGRLPFDATPAGFSAPDLAGPIPNRHATHPASPLRTRSRSHVENRVETGLESRTAGAPARQGTDPLAGAPQSPHDNQAGNPARTRREYPPASPSPNRPRNRSGNGSQGDSRRVDFGRPWTLTTAFSMS